MSSPVDDGSINKKQRLEDNPVEVEGDVAEAGFMFDPNRIPDVVLQRFLEVCDLAALKKFRLVHTNWYDLSLTRFRKSMTLVIHAGDLTREDLRGRRLAVVRRGVSLDNWCNIGLNIETKKFKNFRVLEMEFGKPDQKAGNSSRNARMMFRNVRRFWGDFGEWISKLELRQSKIHDVQVFKKAIFHDTPNLQELRLIRIENKTEDEPDNGEQAVGEVEAQPNLTYLKVDGLSDLPVTWSLMFSHFPRIQTLEVVVEHEYEQEQMLIVHDIRQQLQAIQNDTKRVRTITVRLRR